MNNQNQIKIIFSVIVLPILAFLGNILIVEANADHNRELLIKEIHISVNEELSSLQSAPSNLYDNKEWGISFCEFDPVTGKLSNELFANGRLYKFSEILNSDKTSPNSLTKK
jgi:hypothetical protein